MIQFYGYKKCDTCRKAEKALQAQKMAYAFIDITENPPSEKELKTLVSQSGEKLQKFFNTSGVQYKELGIKDKIPGLSETEILKMLSKNGRLLKRPIVTDGKKTTVGFQELAFANAWMS